VPSQSGFQPAPSQPLASQPGVCCPICEIADSVFV
jgi:hypothetical protein